MLFQCAMFTQTETKIHKNGISLGHAKRPGTMYLVFWITPMKVFNLQKLLYRYTSSFCSVEVFVFVIESSQTPGISFKEAVIEPGQLEIYLLRYPNFQTNTK